MGVRVPLQFPLGMYCMLSFCTARWSGPFLCLGLAWRMARMRTLERWPQSRSRIPLDPTWGSSIFAHKTHHAGVSGAPTDTQLGPLGFQNSGHTHGFGCQNATPILGTKTRPQFWVPYLKFNRSPSLGPVFGTQNWGRVLVPKTGFVFRFGPRSRLCF